VIVHIPVQNKIVIELISSIGDRADRYADSAVFVAGIRINAVVMYAWFAGS
jgi:hypothetical protein